MKAAQPALVVTQAMVCDKPRHDAHPYGSHSLRPVNGGAHSVQDTLLVLGVQIRGQLV